MDLKKKEQLVADIINDSKITPSLLEYVKLEQIIEWCVIIKRKGSESEKVLCWNSEDEMRMVAMFLDTLIKLAKEKDCPDFFKSEITIDRDFVHNVLKNVCINNYFNKQEGK